MTGATLFSGFGGVDIAMMQSGVDVRWSLEYDAEIASVAKENLTPKNGFHAHRLHVGDILDADPNDFEPVDILHASPPCPNFSAAKTGAKETEQDLELARKVTAFIKVLNPKHFTLENVYGYRLSKSLSIITGALVRLGYRFQIDKLNAANYGVPQTRERLILWASRVGEVPSRIPVTHTKIPQSGGLFGDGLLPWVGWFEAVEDLVDNLPTTKFAPWQLERLPKDICSTYQIGGANRSKQFAQFARDNRPTMPGSRSAERPVMQVSATSSSDMRAFLVDGQPRTNGTKLTIRKGGNPAYTIGAEHGPRKPQRAFLVSNQMSEGEHVPVRDGNAPALSTTLSSDRAKAFVIGRGTRSSPVGVDRAIHTITGNSNQGATAAYLVDSMNASRDHTCLAEDHPSFTVLSSHMRRPCTNPKAPLSGRVVQLSIRCLARFQDFPDWYRFEVGGKAVTKSLACRGIGNAVPPGMMRAVYRAML